MPPADEADDRPEGFHAGSVPMGGLAVGRDGGTLRTFLGSCIGVALHDRRLRIAGLAHVVLPRAAGRNDTPGKYADTAVPELLRMMTPLAGGAPLRPTAKLVGGARMFAFRSAALIGDQNLAAVEEVLAALAIPVLGRCCGGTRGRRVSFDIATGAVTVETVGEPPQSL